MKTLRTLRVRSKLSKVAFAGGGLSIREALGRAGEALAPFRTSSLAQTDADLREIDARFGADAALRAAEPLGDLYSLCANIIDMAIAAPDTGVHEAARALCDLIDLCLTRGATDWEAVDVHIEVMRLLRLGAGRSESHRDLLLAGLKQVTLKRLGLPGATAH